MRPDSKNCFCSVIVLFDVIIVSDARCLLLDFLIGQRNRKNAKKIHLEQSFKNRIHMGYIQPMLSKNKESFKKYHVLYLAVIYSLIPQYIALQSLRLHHTPLPVKAQSPA